MSLYYYNEWNFEVTTCITGCNDLLKIRPLHFESWSHYSVSIAGKKNMYFHLLSVTQRPFHKKNLYYI